MDDGPGASPSWPPWFTLCRSNDGKRFTYPPAGSHGWHSASASAFSFTAMGIRSWRIASCNAKRLVVHV